MSVRIRSLDAVLSPQQRDIAIAVARGEKNESIAARLGIRCVSVVKTIALARDKVGAGNREQLGDYARRMGWI